jgi:hypothetical protein
MRIIAGLCWYNESPTFLAATVASLKKMDVDHVVAIDGAYMLYPQGKGHSSLQEAQTIQTICDSLDIGYTIHTMPPQQKWRGGEVEKRNFMFQIAGLIADDGDWFLSIDADEVIESVNIDLKAALEATSFDAALLTLEDKIDPQDDSDGGFNKFIAVNQAVPNTFRQPSRRLFRILPGFRVEANHYTYLAGYGKDEKRLWGAGVYGTDGEVPALDLTGKVIMEHRQNLRDKSRSDARWSYYVARDEAQIETLYEQKDVDARDSILS